MVAIANTYYVSTNGSHTIPYDSWERAASNVHAAVDFAGNNDEIVVGPGLYFLTNTVTITNSVLFRSASGREVTILDGANAMQCLHLDGTGVVVRGFRIQNGRSAGSAGGVWSHNSTIEDCAIVSNTVTHTASGDAWGGGLYMNGGQLLRSFVAYNVAHSSGIYTDNDFARGGGLYCYSGAAIRNCIVYGNTASSAWGGSYGGGIDLWGADIVNCTIVDNSAGSAGGLGSSGGTVVNSIIYSNSASLNPNYAGSAVFQHCCTIPLITNWVGNITNAPSVVDWSSPDLHLRAGSLCIDAGTNTFWSSGDSDIDSHPRQFNGAVDIGADETYVQAVEISMSNSVETFWIAPVSAKLQLKRSQHLLTGIWSNVGSVVTSQSSSVTIPDMTATQMPSAFYRLQWQRD